MEDFRQTPPGGGEGDGQVGGEHCFGWHAVEQPLQREAVVEREDLAETLNELLVAHDSRVADGDAVVIEPAFCSAFAGADDGFAVGEFFADERAVERGIEVGQARSDTQADGEGAGRGGPRGRDVLGHGRAAEGRGGGVRLAEALLAGEFVENPLADFGERVGGEYRRGEREEPWREVAGDEATAVSGGFDGVGGGPEGAAGGVEGVQEGFFHGLEDGGIAWDNQGFSVIRQHGESRGLRGRGEGG